MSKIPETVQDFIDFYEAIPEKEWCMEVYTDREGRHCALGHVKARFGDERSETIISKLYDFISLPVDINDNTLKNQILGDTPKQRILNALRKRLNQTQPI